MAFEVTSDVEGAEEFKQAMQRFDSGMQRHLHRQLASWAADVKALAKQFAPVRTGHLRSSIYAKIQEWVAEIGAEATYALFVELGTRYMQVQPYLYPAIQEQLPRLEQIILEALDAAKTEANL
ncbi:MAG: HK97 gp10 family phage protein [Candidatus Bathyarchaeota archaeon]|nr:HK97 gp10 family phage protein [Candidatus Bathyarchaeota archaeon]